MWPAAYRALASVWCKLEGMAIASGGDDGRLWGAWAGGRVAGDELHRRILGEGILEIVKEHSRVHRRAATYNFPMELRRTLYGQMRRRWENIEQAIMHPRPCHSIRHVNNKMITALLRRPSVVWDGRAALDILSTLPPDAQVEQWKNIMQYPSGPVCCSWSVSPECGRLQSEKPNVQAIPRLFRKAAVMGNGGPLREIDLKGFHGNIARRWAGMDPLPDPWAALAERANVGRERVKDYMTPHYYGQDEYDLRWKELTEGQHFDLDEYHAVMDTADALGLSLSAFTDKMNRDVMDMMRDGADVMEAVLFDIAPIMDGTPMLPLHDAVIFAGTEAQADAVHAAMQKATLEHPSLRAALPCHKKADFPQDI